jgi:MFS family permease
VIAQALHLPRIARLGERPNVTRWITHSGPLAVTLSSKGPTVSVTTPTPTIAAATEHRTRPGVVLALVCSATALVIGMVAAVNLAVPMLASGSLHPSAPQLLWIVDAYVVLFACLVIPGGALGDRLGRKGVLLTGLVVFAAGAAASAAAPTATVMLVGRAVSGIGAACVLPNTLAVLLHATPRERRSTARRLRGRGAAVRSMDRL